MPRKYVVSWDYVGTNPPSNPLEKVGESKTIDGVGDLVRIALRKEDPIIGARSLRVDYGTNEELEELFE